MVTVELGDITKTPVECIVNAANHSLMGGGGVDGAIHKAAGPGLLKECESLPKCDVGEVRLTSAWNLSCSKILHTVGPVWQGGHDGESDSLAKCYQSCLRLAKEVGIRSIAFPAISTGVFGFPSLLAARIAYREIKRWEKDNPTVDIWIVCFQRETYEAYHAVMEENSPKS